MDIFTQKRITLWIIVLLVVLNLSTLIIIWRGQQTLPVSRPVNSLPHSERTLELLQQELGFTDQQIQQYDQLRRTHAQQTRPLIRKLQQLKRRMMDEILTDHPDSVTVQQTAQRIGDLQAQVEALTFTHFLDLKELCGEEQVEQLKELIAAFHQRTQGMQGRPPGPEAEGRPMHPPPGRE